MKFFFSLRSHPKVEMPINSQLGALDEGTQCHVSNLRNDNDACPLILHVACRL